MDNALTAAQPASTLPASSVIPADGADIVRFVAFAVGSSLALGAFGVQVCPYLHASSPASSASRR
jgi:hypothetical protein